MAKKFLKNADGGLYIDKNTGKPITVDVPDGNEVSGVSPTYWVQDKKGDFSLMIMPFKITNQNIVDKTESSTDGVEVFLK